MGNEGRERIKDLQYVKGQWSNMKIKNKKIKISNLKEKFSNMTLSQQGPRQR